MSDGLVDDALVGAHQIRGGGVDVVKADLLGKLVNATDKATTLINKAHTQEEGRAILAKMRNDEIKPDVAGKIVVDATVPLVLPRVAVVQLPGAGSPAVVAQRALGPDTRVVSAFHHVGAKKFQGGEKADCDVLVFGHTHKPWIHPHGDVLFVNCGSVGKPKDGDPRAAFGLLELDAQGAVRATVERVPYDAAAVSLELLAAGLPGEYAEKLVTGT